MVLININYIIILILISYCSSIRIDYYVDHDESTSSSYATTKNIDARRIMMNELLQSNKSIMSNGNQKISTTYNNDENIDDDDNDEEREEKIIEYYNIPRKQNNYKFIISEKARKNLSEVNSSSMATARSLYMTSHTTTKLRFNSFQEYDYKILNETDSDDDDDMRMLRQQAEAERLLQTQNNTLKDAPYARFYNLEPAVNQEMTFDKKKKIFRKTWYVPQDFPCWELPILYGELGTRKKKSNVFLIYGGNLVNVIDPLTETQSSYKVSDPPMSHIVNKWCEVEPCYGDHTLCLFQNKKISNICDKEYKVHVPTIVDQFALVNTVNTMRNRIANGVSRKYPHLPTAANMKQITYDYDLEEMAEAWLHQCLPGAAPCSALDGNLVSHLECMKYADYCCKQKSGTNSQCVPRTECYVYPIIGCIHTWFYSAGKNLMKIDVQCGRSSVASFNTVQLLWAKTNKIGCAYGERSNGDIRVVCNFSPGAPFSIETKLYCGIIVHNDIKHMGNNENMTDLIYLASLGIKWSSFVNLNDEILPTELKTIAGLDFETTTSSKSDWGVDSLTRVYNEGWVGKQLGERGNGTRSLVARLVAKYTFIDESESRCDSDESIYEIGNPGSMCVERGRIYHGLCYDFRDPTPGYRLIAVAAPIVLFSLILYDLFSGVIRQTNY